MLYNILMKIFNGDEDKVDNALDFYEDNRKKIIIITVIVVLTIIMFTIRGINQARGLKKEMSGTVVENTMPEVIEDDEDEEVEEEPVSQYKINIGLEGKKNSDGRVVVEAKDDTEVVVDDTPTYRESTYDISVRIYDKTGVPETNMDGSHCKDYLDAVTLADFGTNWGEPLTEEDYTATTRYLVGVQQDKNDFERGDLQSVGWVLSNFDKIQPHDAVKFTNLHVIGSLSATHTAVLCSYDWYSVFGMKDTLVVFEDISGTLDASKFVDGAIFSATVYGHNMKVLENVNGQRVLCVQYNVFE